jgi:hypothetical protein
MPSYTDKNAWVHARMHSQMLIVDTFDVGLQLTNTTLFTAWNETGKMIMNSFVHNNTGEG